MINRFNVSEDNRVTVHGLQSYRNYTISVNFDNSGAEESTQEFTTNSSLPGTPFLKSYDIQSKSYSLRWNDNGQANGELKNWLSEVYYCESNRSLNFLKNKTFEASKTSLNVMYSNDAHKCYTIVFYIVNDVGKSPIPFELNITTDYEHPLAPNLVSVEPYIQNEVYGINLTWVPPDKKQMPESQAKSLRYQLCYVPHARFTTFLRFLAANETASLRWANEAEYDFNRLNFHLEPVQSEFSSTDIRCVDLVHKDINFSPVSAQYLLIWDSTATFEQPLMEFSMRCKTDQYIRPNRSFYSYYSNSLMVDLKKAGFPLSSSDFKIVLTVLILVLIFIVCAMTIACYLRCSYNKQSRRRYEPGSRCDMNGGVLSPMGEFGTNGMCAKRVLVMQRFENSPHKPILTTELLSIVPKLHADANLGFQKEFEELDAACSTDWPALNYKLPTNLHKNRYSNVYPYDHTRVVLNGTSGGTKSGYINANYVDGFHRQNAYIATQVRVHMYYIGLLLHNSPSTPTSTGVGLPVFRCEMNENLFS
ncbi:hypothetical protein Ciccas_000090 [Cichlidogyrus casuarinus]|uniref:Tyrosine-protein phosphatase domain-containing protein n=1 Tax=Cichlidogyrus casuarinus TaxID=1844966 RepID=A0ABD2QNW3_9PLAT